MDTNYNPMIAALQGQQVGESLANAQAQGLSWRERLAMKKAMAAMGSQNYFAGYEGVPGAERPDYLKDAYPNVSPEDAMKLENFSTQKLQLDRAAEQAGKVRAETKAADLQFNKDMLDYWSQSPIAQEAMNQGQNAFGQFGQVPGTGVLLPGQTMAGARQTHNNIEQTIGFGPTGLTMTRKMIPGVEVANKESEIEARRAGTTQARDTYTQKSLQDAIANVQAAQRTFREAQAALFQNPAAIGQVNYAQQELAMLRRELDEVQRGLGRSTQGEMMPSPRTPAAPSATFGIPGMEQLSGHQQQEVGAKEVLVQRDRARGQEIARDVIQSLRDQYTQLNTRGGITNTEKDPVSNVMAGAASSSPGQYVSNLIGTKSQSLRNTIAQQRPILMQAIMKASGMTAKQLDSNVDLKLWLQTATDPSMDFQANMKALDTLEQLYGTQVPPQAAPQKATVAPGKLPQGAKQIGTSGGKPVYQLPNGSKVIDE